jgi:hypothetical protein
LPRITDVTLADNTAELGGGMYGEAGCLFLLDNSFSTVGLSGKPSKKFSVPRRLSFHFPHGYWIRIVF